MEAMQSYSTSADPLHIWPNSAISSKAKWPVRFHVHSIFYPHVDFQLCQTVRDGSIMLLPNVPTTNLQTSQWHLNNSIQTCSQVLGIDISRGNTGWENAREQIIKAYTNEQTLVWHLNGHLVRYNLHFKLWFRSLH